MSDSSTPSVLCAPLRVVVAEDHAYLRETLSALLSDLGVLVVGEAHNGLSAIALATEHEPDLIIMDMSMPDLTGLEATRRVLAVRPATRVIALSAHCDVAWVELALAAGAAGYVLKDMVCEDLPTAIHEVVSGGHFVSRQIHGGARVLQAHLTRPAS